MYLILGTTTWLVTQILAVPLRPVSLRPALETTRRKWKTFAGTGMLSAVLTLLGYALCIVPGVILSVVWALVAPVVMMEELRGFAALKRSKTLVLRSLRTTVAAVFIMFVVPLIFGAFASLFVAATVKTVTDIRDKITARNNMQQSPDANTSPERNIENVQIKNGEIQINTADGAEISKNAGAENDNKVFREIFREGLSTILMLPIQILLVPLSSIILALLYLKTRQAGGESLQDLLAQFEEADQPRTNWQRRVHARLEQSGKVTSKS